MKKISLLLTTILFIGFTASAQRGKSVDFNERAEKQTTLLKEELKLTDVQFEKMMTLNKVQAEKRQEMRNAANEDRMQMRDEMKADREKYAADVKSILTPEQFTKYEEMMAARKEQMKNGQRENGRRADGNPDAATNSESKPKKNKRGKN